jgi:hypothetical protein
MLKPNTTSSTEYNILGLNNDQHKQDMSNDYHHRLSCQGLRDRDVSDLAHEPKHQASHSNSLHERHPVDRIV